ncbi:SRPBCC family protein [Flavobacterium sp. F-328]|uniref:SRPBCC family protein n=1 Tax=Flavobacterium erciyesense TaxID=2825842 RepID=A0ABS5D5R1_9FLAO|nr:SRPBCC family protein [Flavobacterium erciyesense]MBQ0909383.1 SRPBCC family protein [Flavobacterium erciyesense]
MTTIQLTTRINAPIEIIFDLSRNIDVHQQSTAKSNETAIAGITSGLINLNETVTWRGKHFGIYLKHKSLISAMEIPTYFVDEMLEGKFKSFKHQHTFIQKKGFVIMEDKIQYETPYGIFGKIFDHFLLKKHLTKFISERNYFIKSLAENHQK